MLEQQQQQLVNGLQELYAMVISNRGWEGSPLKESIDGHHLTHDILERLGALNIDSNLEHEGFEEDLDALRQKLSPKRIESPRNGSLDSEYQHPGQIHDATPPQHYFNDSFSSIAQFPPPPPVQNTPKRGQASMNYIDAASHLSSETGLDSSTSHPPRPVWAQPPAVYDHNLDFLRFNPSSNFDALDAIQERVSPCLPISPWLDDELGPFEASTSMT